MSGAEGTSHMEENKIHIRRFDIFVNTSIFFCIFFRYRLINLRCQCLRLISNRWLFFIYLATDNIL